MVDFSEYLDLNKPPPPKKKSMGFDFSIGDPMENSSLTAVEIKETTYNPFVYQLDEDILMVAALYGGPLY